MPQQMPSANRTRTARTTAVGSVGLKASAEWTSPATLGQVLLELTRARPSPIESRGSLGTLRDRSDGYELI